MCSNNIEDNLVCVDCVDDSFLVDMIVENGNKDVCSYCETKDYCIDLVELTHMFGEKFEEYYQIGESFPRSVKGSDNPIWESDGDSIANCLMEIGLSDERVAEDMVYLLRYREFLKEHYNEKYQDHESYVPKEFIAYNSKNLWERFCEIIKHESRFLSDEAKDILKELLQDISSYTTGSRQEIVTTLATSSDIKIFRGREVQTKTSRMKVLHAPESELGAPPSRLAKAGRLNPAGISVFYGAFDRKTCIAELRPTVGSYVIIGEFAVTKALKLLDLRVFRDLYEFLNFFDPNFEDKLDRRYFLNDFHELIIKPVLPDDSVLDYLPTQFFAEYLKNEFQPKIHGILYGSSQSGKESTNIVLFRDIPSFRNVNYFNPKGSFREEWNDDDDGLRNGYAIWFNSEDDIANFKKSEIEFSDSDVDPCVKLVKDSIRIHKVQAVKYEAPGLEFDIYQIPCDPLDI